MLAPNAATLWSTPGQSRQARRVSMQGSSAKRRMSARRRAAVDPSPTPPTPPPPPPKEDEAFERGYAAGLAAAAAAATPSSPPLARSAAKGVSWRLFSAAITVSLAAAIFGGAAFEQAGGGAAVGRFAAAEFCLKLGIYVAHERLWAWLDGKGGAGKEREG